MDIIEKIRLALSDADKKGKLTVVAAVNGIPARRLRQIRRGSEPTAQEISMLAPGLLGYQSSLV